MISFVLSQCIVLPIVLFPLQALFKTKLITKKQREVLSLKAGQLSARTCLRLIPFAKVDVTPSFDNSSSKEAGDPEPSIWVCNHTSMLDVFIMLASDKKLRGKNRRPIKIVYWKQLEANPVTASLFRMCGFIPIDMEANAPGEQNKYDRKTFKAFLMGAKKAFEEGFDIGILPEGQLNPEPEKGLLPVFGGAYTLAKMSKRPIRFIALNGLEKLWHPVNGMDPIERNVKVRGYPGDLYFESADDFTDTFTNVVGKFGSSGQDISGVEELLSSKRN